MLKFPPELESQNHYSESYSLENFEKRIVARLWVPIGKGGEIQEGGISFFCIHFIFNGFTEFTDDKGTFNRLKPGNLFFRHPGRRYKIIRKNPKKGKAIEFQLRIPKDIYEHLVALGMISEDDFIINIGLDQLLLDKCVRFINKIGSYAPVEFPLFNLELMNFIYDLKRRKNKPDTEKYNLEKIKQSCQYLSENYEQKISVPDCAKKFGMGYQNYRKTFTKIIGISPQEYRIRKRVEAANELIEYSDLSLKEIAEKLGYPSFANFALQFKKFTGNSPGSIRKK